MKTSVVTRIRNNRSALKNERIDKYRYEHRLRRIGLSCGLQDIIILLSATDINDVDMKLVIDAYLKYQHMTPHELSVKIVKYFADELAEKWSEENVKNE